MTTLAVTNNLSTTLSSALTASSGSQTVQVPAGTAATINASMTAGKAMILTIANATETAWEIVLCTLATAGAPNVLTITRAYEATPTCPAGGNGLPWPVGSKIEARLTAGVLASFLVLDLNGNAVGTFIPRTASLVTGLQSLTTEPLGELAVSTDTPAIVSYTGSTTLGEGSSCHTFYPFMSAQSISVTDPGSHSVTPVLPCTTDVIRLSIATTITSFTATIANGYIDGQELKVEIIGAPTLANLVIAGITYTALGLAGTMAPYLTVAIRFKWNATAAIWSQIGNVERAHPNVPASGNSVVFGTGSVSAAQGVSIGYSGSVSALQGIAIGTSCSVVGPNGLAFGYQATALGANSYAFGHLATAAADVSMALGESSFAGGANSCAIYSQQVWGWYAAAFSNANVNFVGGLSALSLNSGGVGNPAPNGGYVLSAPDNTNYATGTVLFTTNSVGTAPYVLQVGDFLTLPSNLSTYYVTAQITNITGTRITATVMQKANAAATGIIAGAFYTCMDGYQATAIGYGAQAHNQNAIAEGGFLFAAQGDAQSEKFWLGAPSSGATAVTLTTDGTGTPNAFLGFGASNRFITEPNKAYLLTVRILGKQAASANVVKLTRELVVVNNAGTVTIAQAPVTIGTDLLSGSITAGSVTFTANATQKSLDIAVTPTGVAGGVVWKWLAEINAVEVLA